MREYATQMEAARKGIITEELKKVAEKEMMTSQELFPLVAAGKVVICANKNHKCVDPQGIGSMLKTKINVNLGVSRDCKDYELEMKKVMEAVHMVLMQSWICLHGIPFLSQKANLGMSGYDRNSAGI